MTILKQLLSFAILIALVACASGGGTTTNTAPTADFTFIIDGLEVTFDASASSDVDGNIVAYAWDFNDGGKDVGDLVRHTFEDAGSYQVSLTVTDNGGKTDNDVQTITVEAAAGGSISGQVFLSRALDSKQWIPRADSKTRNWQVPDTVDIVLGEALVVFKDIARTEQSLRLSGLEVERVRPVVLPQLQLVKAKDATLDRAATLEMIAQLNRHPDVLSASPNTIVQPASVPNDEFFPLMWHLNAINMPQAWDITLGSEAITVGIVDTGLLFEPSQPNNVQLSHPEFVGKVVAGFDFISDPSNAGDGTGRDANPYDTGPKDATSYHGSHVAGTVAANTNNGIGIAGVDQKARLQGIRVLGLQGGSTADILDGSAWSAGFAIDGVPANPTPAAVINLSIQGEAPCDGASQQVFSAIANSGTIVVVAAGNSNFEASRSWPGNCSDVITVGASDFASQRAAYSNFGPEIEVMAPGGDTSGVDLNNDGWVDGVLSTVRDDFSGEMIYEFYQGTSMAAPHVAGVASLMKSINPNISQAAVLEALRLTARPLSSSACSGQSQSGLSSSDCGAGVIDAHAALQLISQGPPPVAEVSLNPTALDFGLGLNALTGRLINSGNAPASFSLVAFGEDNANPGDVLDGILGADPLAGNIAANSEVPIQVFLDRQQAPVDGSYRLTLIIDVDGEELTLPILFSVSSAPPPPPLDINGTFILACVPLGDDCDLQLSREIILTGSGLSGSYQFDDLAAGSYEVYGYKDTLGDGFTDGDFFGFYTNDFQGVTPVLPPETNVNFLIFELDFGAGGLTVQRFLNYLQRE